MGKAWFYQVETDGEVSESTAMRSWYGDKECPGAMACQFVLNGHMPSRLFSHGQLMSTKDFDALNAQYPCRIVGARLVEF